MLNNKIEELEELIMIPKKIYLNYINEDDEVKTWSENPTHDDCNILSREYTDLLQLWHDSSEIPQNDSLILVQSVYGDIILQRYINRKSGMSCIFKWAYIDDLLPKGSEDA